MERRTRNINTCLIVGILGMLCCGGGGIGLFVIGSFQLQETRDQFAEADRLYESGDIDAAIPIYKDTYYAADNDEQRRALERIVRYELDNGDREEAHEWAEIAAEAGATSDDTETHELISGYADVLRLQRENREREKRESQPVNIGDEGILRADHGGRVLIATTDDSFDRMLELQNANDPIGLEQLEFAGLVVSVSPGTRVRKINSHFGYDEVRILAGSATGVSGFVQTEFVRHP